VAKEVLGESRGKIPEDKHTWWWERKVQTIISKKESQYKVWQKSRRKEN